MKVIFSGLEGSGKSLKLAMTAANLVDRNNKFQRRTKTHRDIYSNLKFSDEFYKWATEEKRVRIFYWDSLEQILYKDGIDVIMDEVGNYFDARKYAELPNEARRWVTQGNKRGVEIYGSAQDFSQVDVMFRRLVGGSGGLFHIRKLWGSPRPHATRPPVKHIWGVCSMMELDPINYDSTRSLFEPKSVIPSLFFIEKKYCKVFDTSQKIVRGEPPRLRHEERICELPNCAVKRISHA